MKWYPKIKRIEKLPYLEQASGHVQIVAFRKLEIEFSKLKLIFLALNCVLAFFLTKLVFLCKLFTKLF